MEEVELGGLEDEDGDSGLLNSNDDECQFSALEDGDGVSFSASNFTF